MTTTITPVTMYPCPVSGRLYKTERGARASAKRALEKQEQEAIKLKEEQKSKEEKEAERDWLRMNLEDINDLPILMKQRAKELYDWDLDVSFRLHFGTVSNSHNCPINGVTNWGNIDPDKPASYLGWSGQVNGTLNGKCKRKPLVVLLLILLKRNSKSFIQGQAALADQMSIALELVVNLFLMTFLS